MKIRYVQLESQAFLTDLDFITMSAGERGVYCTLLLHLYCNAGRCEFDPQALARLCNCDDFEKVWEKVAKKFQKSILLCYLFYVLQKECFFQNIEFHGLEVK